MKSGDLGGRQNFGPVRPEPDEPAFHADWERQVFALVLAMGGAGLWTLDASRDRRESLPPETYLRLSYYGIWFTALERLMSERGVLGDSPPPVRVLQAHEVRQRMAAGGPSARPGPPPCYGVGDKVAIRRAHPEHHTRVPTYLRGAVGTVTALYGCHVFPDTNAHGLGENPQPLYNVTVDAQSLWGPDTTATEVRVDLFEPYLEPA